jgi:hypothetical protein
MAGGWFFMQSGYNFKLSKIEMLASALYAIAASLSKNKGWGYESSTGYIAIRATTQFRERFSLSWGLNALRSLRHIAS